MGLFILKLDMTVLLFVHTFFVTQTNCLSVLYYAAEFLGGLNESTAIRTETVGTLNIARDNCIPVRLEADGSCV